MNYFAGLCQLTLLFYGISPYYYLPSNISKTKNKKQKTKKNIFCLFGWLFGCLFVCLFVLGVNIWF